MGIFQHNNRNNPDFPNKCDICGLRVKPRVRFLDGLTRISRPISKLGIGVKPNLTECWWEVILGGIWIYQGGGTLTLTLGFPKGGSAERI